MAIGDTIGEVTGGILGNITSMAFLFFAIVIGLCIGGFVVYYFAYYRKKFDITVKIISKRVGENKVFFDKAAILKDRKNNMEYLKLLKLRAQIELPKFDIFYHTNKGDYVEIIRESEKGFRFLAPPVIDDEYVVRRDGKVYPITLLKQRQMENDISWILNRERINKNIISPESFLMKLLAYTPQIISAVISMMILWMVLRYAPTLMESMREFAETIKSSNEQNVIGGVIIFLLRIWK